MKNDEFARTLEAITEPTRFSLLLEIIRAYEYFFPTDTPPYRGNCIKILKKKVKLTQPTISHHLKILEEARLIEPFRVGKWIHYLPKKSNLNYLLETLNQKLNFQSPAPKHIKIINLVLNEKDFKELISLIENHGYKNKHYTKRNSVYVTYLQNKASQKTFILIYNPDTKLLNIQSLKDYSKETSDELIDLIQKYAPTLKPEA